MAILWAGTSIADIGILGGAPASVNTNYIKSPDVLEGIDARNSGDTYTPTFPPASELWFGGYFRSASGGSGGNNQTIIGFVNPAGQKALRVGYSGSRFTLLRQSAASAYETLNTGLFGFASAVQRFDAYLKIGASGIFRFFVDGQLCAEYLGNTIPFGGASAVTRVSVGAIDANGVVFSACILADEDTRPLNFYQKLPTGNGAETAWTGDYTAVDETGFNDADFIAATAPNTVETFTFPAHTGDILNRKLVTAVLSARARNNGAIAKINGISRIGSTNYESEPHYENSPAFAAQQWYFDVNPATGQPWTVSEINAAQFGVKAA